MPDAWLGLLAALMRWTVVRIQGGAERIFLAGGGLGGEGQGVERGIDRGSGKVVAPSLSSGAGGGRQNTVCARSSENVLALGATVGGGPGRWATALRGGGVDGARH